MYRKQEKIYNQNMEQQIVSMIENVLDDDSDEDGMNTVASSRKNLNDFEEKSFYFEERFCPKEIKENKCTSKFFTNEVPLNQALEPPASEFKRKYKKYNTAHACTYQNTITIDSNKSRAINGGYLGTLIGQNISFNYRSNCNPLRICPLENLHNYNSHNTTLTNSSSTNSNSKNNSKSNEDIPPDELYWNEYDEILEHRVRPKEEIDEEIYDSLKGKFFNVLMTQNGSRVLQKALKNTNYKIILKMLEEISDKFDILMTDSYANYFCPKFFSILKKEQRKILLNKLKNNIYEIAVSKIGTYPLQSILDELKLEEEKLIVADSIRVKILEMCLDPQGTHVVEKMITCFEESLIEDFYNIIIDNMLTLADNVNGLCVCKKIIIHGTNIQTMKRIREKLTENAIFLIQNVYGNYVIQMAIEKWAADFCLPIIKRFQNNLYSLSMQKYSSNVIEKCFENGFEILYSGLIEEISKDSKIIDLIKSPFGNYVIQKALKLSKGGNRKKLISLILKDIKKLEDKKLIAKWKLIVNNIQSVNKNITHPVNVSNLYSNYSEALINSSNYYYNSPNIISVNYNYDRNFRRYVGSPRINSPYLMMSGNYPPNNNNDVYPNNVNTCQNNFLTAFSLNYTTNNNNYYL